jgi:predicted transposase YbfD/YdcC
MTRTPSCHLLDILAEVPDPRKKKDKRHPLKAILGLIVIGLMCNQKSYTAIATWGRTQPKLAKALDFRDAKTPCAATFHNLLKNLDTLDLEHSLTQWVTQTYQGLHPVFASRLTAVSIDGKTLRGSKDPETGNPTHLLAAVSHELGIPLAQCAVSEKTNEVPISRQLLKAFDVSQKVVTTDALLTQRRFCEEIIAHEADYLLPVKGNQKGVYQDIQDLFEPFSETETQEVQTRRFASLHTQEGAHLDTHIAVEKAHGFLTTRTLTASTLLTEHSDWPGLAQVYQYRVERKHLRTGEITQQTQYGITSLAPQDASAEDLLTLRRRHWTIENKVHWIRDVVFGEDASQVRTGGIPQVMAALHNTVLSVLRFNGYTKISQTLRFFVARPKLAVKLII